MNADATITGKREPWGSVLTWEGGHIAPVSRELFWHHPIGQTKIAPKEGEVFQLFNLRLRMIGRDCSCESGYTDRWLVARASDPIAELKILGHKVTQPLMMLIYRSEMAVLAFRLHLPPEGTVLRFSAWCARWLL